MMRSTKRNHPFITKLQAGGAGLGKSRMMGLSARNLRCLWIAMRFAVLSNLAQSRQCAARRKAV